MGDRRARSGPRGGVSPTLGGPDMSGPAIPSRRVATWIVIALCAIWGSTWLMIKEGLRDLPPLTSAAIRFAIAATVFSFLAPFLHRREGGEVPTWTLSAVMAGLCFAVPYGVVYWSETVIPSGLASVLWATFPLFVAVASHVGLPGEHLRRHHWIGFVTGFAGVCLLFATDLRARGAVSLGLGLAFLLSPLSAAVGQTLVARDGRGQSSVLLNRNGLIGATALLSIAAVALEHDRDPRWTAMAVGSIAYLSIVGTVVTFGLYFWLLRHASSHRLSLTAYLIPMVALALGATVGQEPVGASTLAGAALIIGGVALVFRAR